jgi:glyoxylase-like metal-dependent hydrolase (beta-lactamase superfamily II)
LLSGPARSVIAPSCPIVSNSLEHVLVASFPAGLWQTNCYLVATAPSEECVIIDPGMDAAAGVAELILEHRLKPVAVMVTHGHIDHMFSVTPLCRSYASSCWVHPSDRVLLTDPLRASWLETRLLLERLTGHSAAFTEPDDVRELTDGAEVAVAGLTFQAIHAPGHTAGSTMFQIELRASGIARRRTEEERAEAFFPPRVTTTAADLSARFARANRPN